MRLIGGAVEVRLSADRYETTQMLQQERGALTDVMQSAGYAFDIASIDHSRVIHLAVERDALADAERRRARSEALQRGSAADDIERRGGESLQRDRQAVDDDAGALFEVLPADDDQPRTRPFVLVPPAILRQTASSKRSNSSEGLLRRRRGGAARRQHHVPAAGVPLHEPLPEALGRRPGCNQLPQWRTNSGLRDATPAASRSC